MKPGRKPDPSKAHGINGYQYYGCRCDVCRAASAEYQRKLRRERRARGNPPTHGFPTYVNWMCRCDVCRAANTQVQRDFQARRKAAL